MLRLLPLYVVIGALLLQTFAGYSSHMERKLSTDKGETHDIPSSHPLNWWTRNPLRLDEGGSLLLGLKAGDGHIINARDYRVEQKVTTIGVISGHRILQVITTIHDRPDLVVANSALADLPPSRPPADLRPSQWKSLLLEIGASDRYVEIYRLQASYGLYLPMRSAAIYGVGQDAILGTDDQDSGNGGGCTDEYWWFDTSGAHPVDFSPLNQAIVRALPPNSMYTSRCWALHPEKAELESWVQKGDANCHACGGLGEVTATYRIEQGAATPVSVRFEPGSSQQK
jgi:hypothetical protein